LFLIHLSFLNRDFLWLEHNDIQRRAAVLPLSQIYKAFTSPFGHTSFYRPAVTISYSLDSAIYGQWLPGFHLTSIFLHLLVAALTPLFLSVFFHLTAKEKLLTTLVIGVHPVASPVVGLIFQRQESLVLIGIMLTLYFYNLNRALPTSAAFALALFSKETALIIVPALILLTKKFHRSPLLLLASLILVYSTLRYSAVPQVWGTPAVSLSLSENIGTRLDLLNRWLFMLVAPLKPTLSDVVPILKITDPKSLFSLFLLIIAFLKIKNKKFLVLFAIMLAPGLNIIPVPRVGSPHYAYLPLIPFALGLVLITRRLGSPLLYLWIAIASVSTFFAGFQYQNDATLFTPEVATDPDFSEAHSYLGNYYLFKGDYIQAESELEQATKTHPHKLYFYLGYPDMINLAGIKFTLGKPAESRNLYQKAKATAPPNLLPYINSALLLLYPSPGPR